MLRENNNRENKIEDHKAQTFSNNFINLDYLKLDINLHQRKMVYVQPIKKKLFSMPSQVV